jgi:iron complex outermembrane receptor protein
LPFLLLALGGRGLAAEVVDFADMTLEELGNIRVISVSKRPETLADAAGSVFVITAEDIRRSGAQSLAEVLRLAPNLHVARAHASGYAISARGLNGSTTSAPNKLLVMIDGRSVYSPLFSGVFWDVQDVPLEDVERIEVISGPGGTLWGINAVNGVINVITRSAEDTRGAVMTAHAGNFATGASFRYGADAAGVNYRVYGKYSEYDHLLEADGSAVDDAWHRSQIGFRADWERSRDQWMVQGNAYRGRFGQPEPGAIAVSGVDLELGTIEASGVNLTARWEHPLDDGASLSIQAWYDRTERTIPPTLDDTNDLIDLQIQHSLAPIGRHGLTWGANYRYGRDRSANTSSIFAFLPAHVNQTWSSLFAQDEIALRNDLRLTLGGRIERNPYTGTEFLPNVRLAWKLAPDHLLWTAVSRAVRGPSRLDVDSHIPGSPPFLLDGGPEVRSEVANVAELGYRGRPTDDLSFSVTAFHSDFDHLRTTEIAPSGTFLIFGNEMEGTSTGIEMWGAWQALPRWRLSAGYTATRDRMHLKPGSTDSTATSAAGRTPSNTWQLRSALTVAEDGDLDVAVRHVGALSSPDVPAYTAVDLRFGWRLQPALELSLAAHNLLDADHGEAGPIDTRSRIPRTVLLEVRWQLQ